MLNNRVNLALFAVRIQAFPPCKAALLVKHIVSVQHCIGILCQWYCAVLLWVHGTVRDLCIRHTMHSLQCMLLQKLHALQGLDMP